MTFILIFLTAIISIAAFNNRSLFDRLAWIPYRAVHRREWYRAITYGFIHGDSMHLIVNMLVLLSFGMSMETLFKTYAYAGALPGAYLTYGMLYFGGLIFSVIADLVRRRNDPTYASIGASGAVSAVVFTSIFFNPWSKIYFFGIVPIPGIVFGVLYLIYERYMERRGGNRVNHNAHIFGALFGFIFPLLLDFSLWRVFIENLMR